MTNFAEALQQLTAVEELANPPKFSPDAQLRTEVKSSHSSVDYTFRETFPCFQKALKLVPGE